MLPQYKHFAFIRFKQTNIIFISTDLPVPDLPSTATFSPLKRLKSMPLRTSRSSNDLYNPVIEITDSCLSMVCCFSFSIVLKISEPVGYLNNYYFFHKYQKHRKNDCLICCLTNTPGSLC